MADRKIRTRSEGLYFSVTHFSVSHFSVSHFSVSHFFVRYIFLFTSPSLLPYFELESDQRGSILINKRGLVMKHPSLLDRRRAALAVIDMQEAFVKIIPNFGETVERVALMVQVCKLLELPIIVTEQYPKGLGRTAPAIADHLPESASPIEKLSFSACGAREFDTRLREH